MSDPNNKKTPLSSPEVARMLGLAGSKDDHSPSFPVAAGDLPVKDLPVAPVDNGKHKPFEAKRAGHGPEGHEEENPSVPTRKLLMLRALRSLIPYVLIFALGIFLYFFFFTKVDFSGAFRTQAKVKTPQQSALEQLQKQNLEGYNKWIAQFYYDVSDTKVLDPDADNSGNGLSNFQKYLLNLNPKSYDTLGLGMADSEALAKGINPVTGNKLNESQQAIVDRYFDMEVIMNRLTLAQMQYEREKQVAGASVSGSQPSSNSGGSGSANAYVPAPLSGNLDIDQSKPGLLEIPALEVKVPVIWTKDPKNFDTDLRSGVVHYPGTAMPGQIGTTYISGHSSNYVWAKGSYNQIFSRLGELPKDSSFKITVTKKDGKQAVLYYIVVGSQQYEAKDQAQFANASKSVVALSTCWPVGSTAKRLVVFGELSQVQE